MKIGVIKDPKQGEARVGMTPENVKILVEAVMKYLSIAMLVQVVVLQMTFTKQLEGKLLIQKLLGKRS